MKHWRGKGYEDALFVTKQGSPVSRYTVEKEINKAVERINNDYKIDCECAGIEPNPNGLIRKFYPHIVRHTFVTRCAEKGIDVRVACALAGHASLSITNDIYTHISETVKILE